MGGSRIITFLFVVGLCALAYAKTKDCTINFKKEFKTGHPLILKPNSSEFYYPTETKTKVPSGQVGFRVACPGGTITVKGKQTNRTLASLECGIKGKFRFAGDVSTTTVVQLKDLKCSSNIQANVRALPSKAGLDRAEIGIVVGDANLTEFLPAIEQLVVGYNKDNVRWAKVHITPTILKREIQKTVPTYRKGVFFPDVEMNDVYVRANQRQAFMEIFNDQEKVDKYLPVTGDKYFVQTQLVSHEDLFFEAQQDAAYVYDNVVPAWEAIAVNGNYKFVGDLLRSLATTTPQGLEVYSGNYKQLVLNDENEVKYINLTNGVQPPQFLYKYVYDPANNKGLVFVTVNNPYVEEITENEVICQKYTTCDIQYPQFINREHGYTYCCRLEDFSYFTTVFDLPTFPGAAPLL